MKVFKIVTSNDNKRRFTIVAPDVVEGNKYKYKIIYKNKIYPIQDVFKIKENTGKKLKIKLICYKLIPDIDRIFSISSLLSCDVEKIKKNMNMYKHIDYLKSSSREKFRLIYEIDNKDKIKILGEDFIENNENKCTIIYRD